jgi:hypothetical protein
MFKAHGFDVIRGAGSKGNLAVFRDDEGKRVHAAVDFIATKRTGRSTREVYMIAGQIKFNKKRGK